MAPRRDRSHDGLTGAARTAAQIGTDIEVGFTRQVGEVQKAVFSGEEQDLSVWGLLTGSTTDHAILQARLAKKVFGEGRLLPLGKSRSL